MSLSLKRVYERPSPEDGTRILVDRLWPRGLRKNQAHVDLWLKEAAPSTPLRRWFGHDPTRWAEFRRRYRRELEAEHQELLSELRRRARREHVTLLFGARDAEHNNAVALRELVRGSPAKRSRHGARTKSASAR